MRAWARGLTMSGFRSLTAVAWLIREHRVGTGMIRLGQVGCFAMVVMMTCGLGPPTDAAPSLGIRLAPLATPVQLRGPGAQCVADGHCRSFNCKLALDGRSYCAEEGTHCAVKGGAGVKVGARVRQHNQCYECRQGLGWQLCAPPPRPARAQPPLETPGPPQDPRERPRALQ